MRAVWYHDDGGARWGHLDRVNARHVARRSIRRSGGVGRGCGAGYYRGWAGPERDRPLHVAACRVVRYDARVSEIHYGRVQYSGILVDRHVEWPLHGRPLALVQFPCLEYGPVVRRKAVQRCRRAIKVLHEHGYADRLAVHGGRLVVEPVHRDGVVVAPCNEQAFRPLVQGELADGVYVLVAARGHQRPIQFYIVFYSARTRVEPHEYQRLVII